MPTELPARWTPVWDIPEGGPAPYPHPDGQRFLLPCHYLFYGGMYEYVAIDVAQARRWLLSGPYLSWLSHPFLHEAFDRLMGFVTPPAQRRRLPALGYHDDALVFVACGFEMLPDLKHGDSRTMKQIVEEHRYTLGLLRRLS